VVSLYLIERRRFAWPYLLPMLFMMVTTLAAMVSKLHAYLADGNTVLLVIGALITAIALWLMVEAALAIRRYRRSPPVESLEVVLKDA
jgi:carbon starvation protein